MVLRLDRGRRAGSECQRRGRTPHPHKHALLPWIQRAQRARDCGQSENAAQEAQSAEDYISQKPLGLRVVYLFSVLWTTPSPAVRKVAGSQGEAGRGSWTPPRPWPVEERPPRQGGTPAVAPVPARRGALSSCPAAACRSPRMRRGFCRSSRDGPEPATSFCPAARPPWPS